MSGEIELRSAAKLVPSDSYFVMGDHRSSSNDSRICHAELV
jgi:hypothetical protein